MQIILAELLLELIISLFSILLIRYIWNKRKIYILSWKLPGPFAFPVIGNALEFFCKDEEILERTISVVSRYSSPMRLWFGPKFTMVISDVYQAEKIMCSVKFATKDKLYKFIQDVNGKSLISGSGPKWKKDRRLISPLFLKKKIDLYFSCILHHTKKLTENLKSEVDKNTFNVEHYLHRCTADFVNESFIGLKSNAQDGSLDDFLKQISRMYVIVHARLLKVWLQVQWLFRLSPYWKEYDEGKRYVHGFMRNALNNAKKQHVHLGTPENFPRSVLDQMLDISDEISDFATDEEFVHHLCTMYTASEDTVTSISSFALVMLGMYPDIQNKVLQEIYDIIGKDNDDINEDNIKKLKYYDMFIREVLRLFPIAPFIIREASVDFRLGEFVIPKGCSVAVSIQNIHRDPKHWEKPNDFYPDHFLPSVVERRHPYAFLPFSAGPRTCIGQPYAHLALKIVLVTILQKYVIEADGKIKDKEIKSDISIRFKDDCYPIRIKNRN